MAARIVVQIVHHALQVVTALEDAVVEPRFPQGAAAIGHRGCTIEAVAAHLEAGDDVAQVARDPLLDVEDGV